MWVLSSKMVVDPILEQQIIIMSMQHATYPASFLTCFTMSRMSHQLQTYEKLQMYPNGRKYSSCPPDGNKC